MIYNKSELQGNPKLEADKKRSIETLHDFTQ
jgi:hypothetical protein